MAIYCKRFIGFETGGTEELGPVAVLPTIVSSPSPASSKETYCARHNWKGSVLTREYTLGTSNEWITVTAYLYFTDNDPDSDADFLQFEDDSGDCWRLRCDAALGAGWVWLVDANNSEIAAFSGLQTSTWHRIQVKFQHSNSTDIQVYLDDTLKLDRTSFDASSGGTEGIVYTYNEIEAPDTFTFYCSHLSILEDDGAYIDSESTLCRDYCVKAYQITKTGIIPDWGSNLDPAESWASTGDTPGNDATDAQYSIAKGTTKSGGCYATGPSGDSDLTDGGTILGASWTWRVANGVGGLKYRVNFSGQYGHDGDASVYEDNYGLLPATQDKVNHHRVEDASGVCPTTSDLFRLGIKGYVPSSGSNSRLDTFEMWACVLYQEAEPSSSSSQSSSSSSEGGASSSSSSRSSSSSSASSSSSSASSSSSSASSSSSSGSSSSSSQSSSSSSRSSSSSSASSSSSSASSSSSSSASSSSSSQSSSSSSKSSSSSSSASSSSSSSASSSSSSQSSSSSRSSSSSGEGGVRKIMIDDLCIVI